MKLFQLFESKELATELLWFRRFISENDLETEVEVDAAEAKRIRTEVLTDAYQSCFYANLEQSLRTRRTSDYN